MGKAAERARLKLWQFRDQHVSHMVCPLILVIELQFGFLNAVTLSADEVRVSYQHGGDAGAEIIRAAHSHTPQGCADTWNATAPVRSW